MKSAPYKKLYCVSRRRCSALTLTLCWPVTSAARSPPLGTSMDLVSRGTRCPRSQRRSCVDRMYKLEGRVPSPSEMERICCCMSSHLWWQRLGTFHRKPGPQHRPIPMCDCTRPSYSPHICNLSTFQCRGLGAEPSSYILLCHTMLLLRLLLNHKVGRRAQVTWTRL